MANYQLSNEALDDLEDIFYYGMELFGIEQAIDYKEKIKAKFKKIAANPLLYQKLNEPLQHYHRSVHGGHSIYYQIEDDGIYIVRILKRQDRENSLLH